MAFVLALTAMIAPYYEERAFASMLFLGSITLTIMSMLLFTREIHIADVMLDVHLSDLRRHQEFQQYLKPKCKRRGKADKTAR